MFDDFNIFDVVTVKMKDDNLLYQIILPGVKKEDISISVTANNLTVETKCKTAYGQTFKYSDSWKYGKLFKIDQAKANLENGVLTITIPKKQIPKQEINYITIE